jgi:hypothetical protein
LLALGNSKLTTNAEGGAALTPSTCQGAPV